MTVKSVIEIEVEDGEFKAFKALFDKYDAAVKKMPGAWANVGKESKKTASTFENAAENVVKQAEHLGRSVKWQKQLRSDVEATGRIFSNMARDTRQMASNISNATISLLKWAGITSVIGGLLGGGGLYGIERLAQGAAGSRRSSLGLGIGIGQQKAFSLNFGRYVDADSLLSGVSGSLTDYTSRGYTGLLGAGISKGFLDKHNAADVSAELLHRLPQIFSGTQKGLIGRKLHDLGLDEFLSAQDVNSYLGASPQERAAQHASYAKDQSGLNVSSQTATAWQNLVTQLDRASGKIETILVNGLVKLADPIKRVSEGFEKAAESFFKSDMLKNGLTSVADGLKTFGKYVNTEKFQTDTKAFITGVGDMASAMISFARKVGWLIEKTAETGSFLGKAFNDEVEFRKTATEGIATWLGYPSKPAAGGRAAAQGGTGSRPPGDLLAKARQVVAAGGSPSDVAAFMAAQGYPMHASWGNDFVSAVVASQGGTPPAGASVASNWRNFGTRVDPANLGPNAKNVIAVRKGVATGDTGSHVTIVDTSSIDPITGQFVGLGGNQGGKAKNSRFHINRYDFYQANAAANGNEAAPSSAPSPYGGLDFRAYQGAAKKHEINVNNNTGGNVVISGSAATAGQ